MRTEKNIRTVYYFASSPHPVHEGFITDPPDGYKIISNISFEDTGIIRQYEKSFKKKSSIASKVLDILKIPRMWYVTTSTDLIHTNSGVLILNKKPWVVSVEYATSFLNLKDEYLNDKRRVKKVIDYLCSDYCKKILPFSYASKESILSAFKEYQNYLEPKLEVVYPTLSPKRVNCRLNKHSNDKVKLLYVGEFFRKGAKELLKAFEVLNRNYNVELTMFVGSYIDESIQEKEESIIKQYQKYRNLHIYKKYVPRDELFKNFYMASDIFILPTFGDWYPCALLEATSCGLPIISSNIFAIPEIVEDGKNGFLISIPEELNDFRSDFLLKSRDDIKRKYRILSENIIDSVVEQLVEKLSILIENKDLREKMGNYSRMMVESGKFSIEEKNRKLKRIYDEALDKERK